MTEVKKVRNVTDRKSEITGADSQGSQTGPDNYYAQSERQSAESLKSRGTAKGRAKTTRR